VNSCPTCGCPALPLPCGVNDTVYMPVMVTVEDHQLLRDELTVARCDVEYWKNMYDFEKEWADAFFSLVNEHDPDLCLTLMRRTEVMLDKD
jgi:hypothetical protein